MSELLNVAVFSVFTVNSDDFAPFLGHGMQ